MTLNVIIWAVYMGNGFRLAIQMSIDPQSCIIFYHHSIKPTVLGEEDQPAIQHGVKIRTTLGHLRGNGYMTYKRAIPLRKGYLNV